ncbi:aminotransferase class I/II-fold pyridoxal phosphate-dependent enzyme [Priestia taiwanensis]|uniref:Lysine decarboxylase n=1 Tax=Priestia taiwanensis TaxID=1347902 RepID=A0A917AZ84_9BACI|nr:aminotransferase class I/II-fold pyridoxal phosphate-dependent enzyme [Priestia taiwanensis]MBM7365202.1 arginine/lysine/ornithine decarboxylase [Priestia taiwanensis]GGE84468.1 lysine decarboxylase [Priestia taiwanensis]
MDQKRTPLIEALVRHDEENVASYHVPGHKNGMISIKQGNLYFRDILRIDATEITGLDDLHDPESCIKDAEQLTALLYEVKKSYFLVNGSTVGNLAMILSVCGENDKVLVQRNCHKSITNGLKLAGAKPVFLPTSVDQQMAVSTGIDIERAKKALEVHQDCKAVILSNPNYYGHTVALRSLIEMAHEYGIPVLVDEAHGAHYQISELFPHSAIEEGADIVVHSAHKTLPAMTMGSYLHVNSNRVDEEKLGTYLHMLQSSSPSYPIMASLDLARYYAAELKEKGAIHILEDIKEWKEEIEKIEQLYIILPKSSVSVDPLKVTIGNRCGLSGFELQSLFERVGIFTEMADPFHVLFVLPLHIQVNKQEILNKMRTTIQGYTIQEEKLYPTVIEQEISPFPYSYKELEKKRKQLVGFGEAANRIASQTVIPYPPGIPLILDGEVITTKKLEQLKWLIESGARFQQEQYIKEGILEVYE